MTGRPPAQLVIDTDFCTDVDDVGALAVAHALADAGRATIRAVLLDTRSRFGPRAVQAVNSFYGRADIPVGARFPEDDSVAPVDYASVLAARVEDRAFRDSVLLLGDVLEDAAPGSVTIASIGLLDNLAELVSSAEGRRLAADRVAGIVVMGGDFRSFRPEFNFAESADATRAFLRDWPTPTLFLGYEVGADVITGAGLSTSPDPADPVAAAYEIWCGRGVGRSSWDLQTVHLAVAGLSGLYARSAPGTVGLNPDGTTSWRQDPGGRHRFVRRVAEPTSIAGRLDRLLARGPDARSGSGVAGAPRAPSA